MPVPPRGPGTRRIVERYDKEPLVSATLAPAPIVVTPITAILHLGVGAVSQGYGGVTYGGATYAGINGPFAPSVQVPRLVTPTTATLVLTGFAPTVTTGSQAATPAGSSQGGGIVPRGRLRIAVRPRTRTRPARPSPQRRPLVVSAPEIDDSDALVALYAAGAIDLEEFAALIAA